MTEELHLGHIDIQQITYKIYNKFNQSRWLTDRQEKLDKQDRGVMEKDLLHSKITFTKSLPLMIWKQIEIYRNNMLNKSNKPQQKTIHKLKNNRGCRNKLDSNLEIKDRHKIELDLHNIMDWLMIPMSFFRKLKEKQWIK